MKNGDGIYPPFCNQQRMKENFDKCNSVAETFFKSN